jgi:2-polyprenyl-6-methoxyphenol hydroxylase-like FAD-dependent oxidoreductase
MKAADAVIVGGGLAGSATAIGLSRAGVSAVIVEKQSFPRDKPCGEGLLPSGVAHLAALGLGDAMARAEGQPFRGIVYRFEDLEAVGSFAPGECGYGVRRSALDAIVHEAARRAPGVEILRGAAKSIAPCGDGVRVRLVDGREVHGRILIGADGPRSLVRRAAGLDGGVPSRGRYGLRQHFELASGAALPDRVEVSFHEGYELYLTPSAPGVVGLAALCERDTLQAGEGSKAERLLSLLRGGPRAVRARLAGAKPASAPLSCGPLRVRARRVAEGRVLLVGDAAGYVDAITGEGMSLALGTSALAARAVAAALRAGIPRERAFAGYARARARLFREHALLTHAVVFLSRHPRLCRRVVARLAAHPDLFSRLLAVNHGARSLVSLGALDWMKILFGSRRLAV